MATYLDRLIKMQAETYGEGETSSPVTGGFLLPNGMFLNMGAYGTRGDDHRVATSVLTRKQEEKFRSRYDAMVHVAKKTGMYRWMPEAWSLEAWTEPTRAQLDTIEELAQYKPLSVEAWKGRSHYAKAYEEWDTERAWKDLYDFYRYGHKPDMSEERWYNPGRRSRKRNPARGGLVGGDWQTAKVEVPHTKKRWFFVDRAFKTGLQDALDFIIRNNHKYHLRLYIRNSSNVGPMWRMAGDYPKVSRRELRSNPRAKTKIRKLSPNTQKVVQVMIESMKKLPNSSWHPSSFTMTMRGYRGNITPAVRYLKEMGLIEVAGYNYDNQPLYKPSKALLEAAKAKKNPGKKASGSLSALNLRKLGLHKPIKTKAQARAWLKKLYKSPFSFHLDDPTWDIPAFGAVAANILDRQRNKARKLLGYEEMWEVYYPVKDNPSKASMQRALNDIVLYDAGRSIGWLFKEYGAKEFQKGITLEDIRSGMDRPNDLTPALAKKAVALYKKVTGYTLLKYKACKVKKAKENPIDRRTPRPKKERDGWTSFWHEGHRVYLKKHKNHELAVMRGEGTMWYVFKDDREVGHHKTLKNAKAAALASVRN